MKRLGVNIDHVATVRNARGGSHPDPFTSAKLALKSGANSITIHLREDRRHIKDIDLKKISSSKKILLNLEIGANFDMLKIALKNKPNYVCIVPEKRKEITTEGGLNLKMNSSLIKKIIRELKKKNIRTSLFIEPSINDIKIAKDIKADCIEIHTGKICNLYNKKYNTKNEFKKILKSVNYANSIGLEVHAGHGITFSSAIHLSKIRGIKEFNIGHFLIGESIFIGIIEILLSVM